MNQSNEPVIALSGIQKRFDDVDVLRNVNLDVKEGEVVVLIGPSGCGKTVLLKSVIGLIEPDAGSLRIRGQETVGVPRTERERVTSEIGMLFQQSALFDSMKIWENVVFRLINEGKLDAKHGYDAAVEKIVSVGLVPETANLYPVELSGGMQKRAALARAIANDPKILLLDEPTAGLDPIMSNVINDLILEIVARLGATVLSVTSDMAGVRKTAGRVAMMHEGTVVWQGAKDAIEDSGNPFVDQFVHSRADGPIKTLVD